MKHKEHNLELGNIAQDFLQLLLEYPPNTSVDLRQVVEQLDIPKRRIYDITNVIEGIELGLKKGHNMFQWTGTQEELLTLAKGNR